MTAWPWSLAGGRTALAGLSRCLIGTRCPVCARVTRRQDLPVRERDAAGSAKIQTQDVPAKLQAHPALLAGLCPECAGKLKPRELGFCPGCATLTQAPDQPVTLCADCRLRPRPWSAVGFFAEYGGELREAVLGLKFGGRLARLGLLRELAWQAYRLHRERPGGFAPQGPDVVTAVPMHWRRLFSRGYNQSLELARGVAGKLGVRLLPEVLEKVRHTRPQSRLSANERRGNLAGAFQADANLVEGKIVLLVDDVMTTGATLEAASRALFASGAARVEVLVLARD